MDYQCLSKTVSFRAPFQKEGISTFEYKPATLNKPTRLCDIQGFGFQNRSYKLGISILSQVTSDLSVSMSMLEALINGKLITQDTMATREKRKPENAHFSPVELEILERI